MSANILNCRDATTKIELQYTFSYLEPYFYVKFKEFYNQISCLRLSIYNQKEKIKI